MVVLAAPTSKESSLRDHDGPRYTAAQNEKLKQIHQRLVEARRELDALIGDAYLRPRANIVPVHFLDLSSAVEKLRWAEKEWRELDRELREGDEEPPRHEAPSPAGDPLESPRELGGDLVEVGPAESHAR